MTNEKKHRQQAIEKLSAAQGCKRQRSAAAAVLPPASQGRAAHRVEEAGGEVGPRGVLLQVYLGILKGGNVLTVRKANQSGAARRRKGRRRRRQQRRRQQRRRRRRRRRRHVAHGGGVLVARGLLRAEKPCCCLPTCIRDSSSLSFIAAAAGFGVELRASRRASPPTVGYARSIGMAILASSPCFRRPKQKRLPCWRDTSTDCCL